MSPGHKVVTREDVTDEKLVAGQLRALQGEVRSGTELTLTAIGRISEKLDKLFDRVGQLERKHDSHDMRIAALEADAAKRRKARKK